MANRIFVNLPVRDLDRSIAFFEKLGYAFERRFSDDKVACLRVADDIFVMLLLEKHFKTFTAKDVADTRTSQEVLVGLSAPTRADVNRAVQTALGAGARPIGRPRDQGFMYEWGFEDLDGHTWEYVWLDPAHAR
jgi:uncharacterized protein